MKILDDFIENTYMPIMILWIVLMVLFGFSKLCNAAPWWETAPGGAKASTTGTDRLPLESGGVGYTVTKGVLLDGVLDGTHTAAADPHTGYMLESNIGVGANNYVQLDGTGALPAVDGSNLTGVSASDDQKIDVFTLVDDTLSLSIESDAEATKTVVFTAWDRDATNDYTIGGADVALADGGTGASLVDPNADRLFYWNDTAGATQFLDYSAWDTNASDDVTASTGLSDSASLVRTTDALVGDVTGTVGATVVGDDTHTHSDSTLPLNAQLAAGVVTAGAGSANLVWKTDASGNPAWRADSTGSSPAFTDITTGTNTSATMTVGTGGSLTYANSGTINATTYKGNTAPDATEFSYLDGVTSAIQTQLNAKEPADATIIKESELAALETDPIVGAIDGIVKANGAGTISAAVAGTDYVAPDDAIITDYVTYSAAVCDGSTDDTATINAELESLTHDITGLYTVGRGRLVLPQGKVCAITDTIHLQSFVTLDLNTSSLYYPATAAAGGIMVSTEATIAPYYMMVYPSIVNGFLRAGSTVDKIIDVWDSWYLKVDNVRYTADSASTYALYMQAGRNGIFSSSWHGIRFFQINDYGNYYGFGLDNPVYMEGYYAATGVATVTIGTAGTGYAVSDIVDIAGGTGGQAIVTSVSAGVPTAVAVYKAGTGYTSGNKATTGAGNNDLTLTITLASHQAITNGFMHNLKVPTAASGTGIMIDSVVDNVYFTGQTSVNLGQNAKAMVVNPLTSWEYVAAIGFDSLVCWPGTSTTAATCLEMGMAPNVVGTIAFDPSDFWTTNYATMVVDNGTPSYDITLEDTNYITGFGRRRLYKGETQYVYPDAASTNYVEVKPSSSLVASVDVEWPSASGAMMTKSENAVITGDYDFGSGGIEIENGTSVPGSCTSGQIFMDTDATSGQRIYGCEAGTFVLQGDGGGAGATDAITEGDSSVEVVDAGTGTINFVTDGNTVGFLSGSQMGIKGAAVAVNQNLYTYSANQAQNPGVVFNKSANATIDTNGATAANESLGNLGFKGNSGSGFTNGGAIVAKQTGTAGTYTPTDIQFWTSNGTANWSESFTIDKDKTVRMPEKAAIGSTPAAGYGYLWVKNTTPNSLIFTDDAGTDTTLGSGGGASISDTAFGASWDADTTTAASKNAIYDRLNPEKEDITTSLTHGGSVNITGTVRNILLYGTGTGTATVNLPALGTFYHDVRIFSVAVASTTDRILAINPDDADQIYYNIGGVPATLAAGASNVLEIDDSPSLSGYSRIDCTPYNGAGTKYWFCVQVD